MTQTRAASEPTRQRARPRWFPRSLAGRLLVGAAVLVFFVVSTFGASTYLALSDFLNNRLDQQLQAVAQDHEAIRLYFNSGGGAAPQAVEVWAVEVDLAGNVVAQPASGLANPMSLPADKRADLAHAAAGSMATVTTEDGQHLRVIVVRVLSPTTGQPTGSFLLGLSTGEVSRTLDHLIGVELLLGAGVMAVAIAATYYGVRFTLRRLHSITDTAQSVAEELSTEGTGLGRRVPEGDPGTEVGRLAESMNTLLAAAELQSAAQQASEDRMRQFLADASHELRTPLTSIRGYAELARMHRRGRSAPDTDEPDNLDRIEFEGTRMSRLVEDLLVLARGDQGVRPDVGRVDVAEVLDDVAAGAHASYPMRHIEMHAEADLVVVGDHDQLLRAVRNLVTNAAVHTTGDIRLSAVREGPWVAIRVSDDGPGLPPDEAAKVFERFWRADKSRARARGGSGLGMSIVASLVSAHRGTVDFASTVERGSTVTVRLPAA